ncbi:MAG: N-acetylmuramoyl-L-alanine amidase [Firmicutes bacterium]|nr:N-acetylmuramoyl-L-alanine amidase [Bacillota bacterium]
MQIIQDFIPVGRRNRPRRANKKLAVTVHDTGNTAVGAGAAAHARYIKGDDAASRPASWHYTVDDKVIYQHLPEDEDAFHAGDGGGDGNRHSIGIEICVNADGNTAQAYENTVWLIADIMRRNKIAIGNVVQHNRWSGKNCPHMLRAGRPYGWDTFIGRVKALTGGAQPEPLPAASAPTLRLGARGDAVLELQMLLNHFLAGKNLTLLSPDGAFGQLTETALRRFQTDKSLTVDGVCGAKTWEALRKLPVDTSHPKPEQPAESAVIVQTEAEPAPSPAEATVDNAILAGVITDRKYWLNVLNGVTQAHPVYVKVLLDNAVDLVIADRDGEESVWIT